MSSKSKHLGQTVCNNCTMEEGTPQSLYTGGGGLAGFQRTMEPIKKKRSLKTCPSIIPRLRVGISDTHFPNSIALVGGV